MIKTFFLLSFFVATTLIASDQVNISDEQNHPFFQLTKGIHINDNAPDLEQLFQQVTKRNAEIKDFYQLVQENGLNQDVKNLLSKHVSHLENERRIKNCPDLNEKILALSLIRGDYCVEKELVSFFGECFQRIKTTPPTGETLQSLYDNAVYIVRKNIQSLKEAIFCHLASRYQNAYYIDIERFIEINELKSEILSINTKESQDYVFYDFFIKFHDQDESALDSIKIMTLVSYLLEKDCIENAAVVQEINSIQLYLNIERALLAYCPDLHFRLGRLGKSNMILEKLKTAHCNTLLNKICNASNPSQKDKQRLTSENYMRSFIKASTNGAFLKESQISYLDSIFPVEKKEVTKENDWLQDLIPPKKKKKRTINKSKKTNKSNKKKARGSVNAKQNKTNHLVKKKIESDTDSKLLELEEGQNEDELTTSLITDEEGEDDCEDFFSQSIANDFSSAPNKPDYITPITIIDEEDEIDFIPVKSKKKKSTKKIIPVSYETPTSYDDYVYKRNMMTTQTSGYVFEGTQHSFPSFLGFDKRLLRLIKKAIHHAPKKTDLPNLASFTLNFHYRVNNAPDIVFKQFRDDNLYLSGGKFFDENGLELKNHHHILCGAHDFLNNEQQSTFFDTVPIQKSLYLGKVLEKIIRQQLVKGGWKDNCLDSEALLLLDLSDRFSDFLSTIKEPEGTVEILGVALQIQSYRDSCWRCRNLIQGWQHDLQNRITFLSKTLFKGQIHVANEFATFVEVVSEITPDTPDYFMRKHTHNILTLEMGNKDNQQHKITSVKPI